MDAPPLGRRLAYRLLGMRMPEAYRPWVEHDLTGPGWRWRLAVWSSTVFAVSYAVISVVPLAVIEDWPFWLAVVSPLLEFALLAAILWRWPGRFQRQRLRRHGFHVADEEPSAALWWPGPPDDPRSEPWR